MSDSYGLSFIETPLRLRQRRLSDQYRFQCLCRACQQDFPLFVNADKVMIMIIKIMIMIMIIIIIIFIYRARHPYKTCSSALYTLQKAQMFTKYIHQRHEIQ